MTTPPTVPARSRSTTPCVSWNSEAGIKLTKAFVMDEGYANVYVKPSVVQTLNDGDEVRITGLGKVNTLEDQTLGRVEIGGRYEALPNSCRPMVGPTTPSATTTKALDLRFGSQLQLVNRTKHKQKKSRIHGSFAPVGKNTNKIKNSPGFRGWKSCKTLIIFRFWMVQSEYRCRHRRNICGRSLVPVPASPFPAR